MKRVWKTKLTVIISVTLIMAGMITACDKDEGIYTDNNITGTPGVLTPTESITDPALPEDTTVTPTSTPFVTSEPNITPEQGGDALPEYKINQGEAKQAIRLKIPDTAYKIDLLDDHLLLDGKMYYLYQISCDGEAIEPGVIVDTQDGTVLYYNNSGQITDLVSFPPDKVEIIETKDETVTRDNVAEVIGALSKEKLNLSKDFSKYKISVDEWTSVVLGKECLCVDVFDTVDGKRQLAGVYYAALDGTVIYRLDEDSNFIKISDYTP